MRILYVIAGDVLMGHGSYYQNPINVSTSLNLNSVFNK